MRDKCFAITQNGGCGILKVQECTGCNFFKTKEQVDYDQLKAQESLFNKGLKKCFKRIIDKDGKEISIVSTTPIEEDCYEWI